MTGFSYRRLTVDSLGLYLQAKNFDERVMLIYDGLHYDALAVWLLSLNLFSVYVCVRT